MASGREQIALAGAADYLAKPGSRLTDDDARLVGPIVEAIAKTSGGKATAKAVLDAARDPTSQLHRFFEWDDSKAAEEYRIAQASHLIRSIEVQYSGKKEDRVRAFHVVQTSDAKGYTPIATILTNEQMTNQLVQRARGELASWARRYNGIKHAAQMAGIFVALESAGVVEPDRPMAAAAE